MQELLVYEYAVIRVVPRVEREEFVNVGVIVFCKKTRFLESSVILSRTKLHCLDPETDPESIEANLQAFRGIVSGDRNSGSAIARLDAASRFRWLTATRSTVIQCSKVHPGMSVTMEGIVDQLLDKLVR
ncbi:DUF3037 domain-containing protein [Niabella drilacis]|uniref:DUF3037 domain-containing protein n=1 Tax=Niabella drilacis (strain DSM 25811 / CCM 8410 / CCUG 62505 / LMG 26954 / E90) TaxID=1285928 RepID=A0A1G6KL11_NIADE|nr:DUF3037 domain-containing protein [Niabella drilacis]SDC31720.1 Protein of unknown function [Niabella drilacis]